MTSVPLHMDPDPDDSELWLPYVDGVIDGRPCRFLLDTGAGKTRVQADEVTAELPVVGTKQSQGLFGVIADDLVKLKTLEVGPITVSDITVVRTAQENRCSLVGMDVLGGMAMVLDLERAVVDFVASGSPPADWPMRRSPNGQPFLELEFSGVGALACWDTGAGITAVDASFHASHEELFTPIGTSVGRDSSGRSQETATYRMAACTVGGITLAPHKAVVVPLPQDPMPMTILLGYPAIRQFVWTMDYPLNRWSATASTPGADSYATPGR
jgi:hypothetical protein